MEREFDTWQKQADSRLGWEDNVGCGWKVQKG